MRSRSYLASDHGCSIGILEAPGWHGLITRSQLGNACAVFRRVGSKPG